MTAFENLSPSQKFRASLHRDVRGICTEALHLLGMDMTRPAMEIVAELVYKKLKIYGTDLEAFAKYILLLESNNAVTGSTIVLHAKRNTVNSEDVKLLVRRNSSLKTHLTKIQPSNPLLKEKRRKTIATTKLATSSSKPKETRAATEDKGDKTENTDTNEVKESEIKDVGSNSKDDSIENRMASEVEQMSVDDVVDLTFD